MHELAQESLKLHAFYRGKVQTALKVPIRSYDDFALWYTPGVAAPCRAIHAEPELVYEHTNKGNTVAIVSDGTRVLGLGDIGPEAGLPVMEGKALLFKYLGGVDAIPLCLNTKDPDELIRTVQILGPSFGGVNLEDICQPKCFHVLDSLRASMPIPVWHDDQQGTALVVLAGLLNALKIVDKRLEQVRIALVGVGAANVAIYRLLIAAGACPARIVACDSKQSLHKGRADIERQSIAFADKWRICQETNEEGIVGGIAEALRGADVCLAFSTPNPQLIQPQWVGRMASDAIVFACANPTPEIMPGTARQAGARIVATGRSDFPNQVNNSLAFPGVFRGVLDVRARKINDAMMLAAAYELAALGRERGLAEDQILPRIDDQEAAVRVAVATGMKAQETGIARLTKSPEELATGARHSIQSARDALRALVAASVIPPAPRAACGGRKEDA
jgi:malate dehydrogenase (oxaloacetate-decarboxylating)